MNRAQLQDQIAPGSVGLALATIWMTYGEAARLVPVDLSEVKYATLTASLGVVFTALVNVVRRFTTKRPADVISHIFEVTADDAERRTHGKGELDI